MSKGKSFSSFNSGSLSELRARLFFVFLGLFIYRLGSYIPVPGLDPAKLAQLFSQHTGGILGVFNMFSGGALNRMSIFALGVMPYISASIIMQLYVTLSPRLAQLRKESQSGERKVAQYTRYITLILSFIQSVGIVKWLISSGVTLYTGLAFYSVISLTLVTGTLFLMWLGEQMTEKGIGNGVSLIIFAGIAARFPSAISEMFMQLKQGEISVIRLLFILSAIFLVTVGVVFFERAQYRVRIHYAKRQQGRKVYAAQSSHLPLKLNMAGVIPPIFALSLVGFPITLASFFSTVKGLAWLGKLALFLQMGALPNIIITAALVFTFTFFYTALAFNAKDIANNLKRGGGFITGIRPGLKTAEYIRRIVSRLTLVCAFYLVFITLLPTFLKVVWDVPFYFGGTSLLIIVVVIMDFIAQVQTHFMGRQYDALLRKR